MVLLIPVFVQNFVLDNKVGVIRSVATDQVRPPAAERHRRVQELGKVLVGLRGADLSSAVSLGGRHNSMWIYAWYFACHLDAYLINYLLIK